MFPCGVLGYGLWWIFPLVMIAMIVLCLFMMRGRMGLMMCRPGTWSTKSDGRDAADPAFDTLKKRYAKGEINKEEYEEKKRVITGHN